jgi:dTDP-4-dehydrorhamnose reductase
MKMLAKRVVILGRGQLAQAMFAEMKKRPDRFDPMLLHRPFLKLTQYDFTDVLDAMFNKQPLGGIVVNCAAFTDVNGAEKDSVHMRVNGYAVGLLGAWCARNGIALVHFSTDYVFHTPDNWILPIKEDAKLLDPKSAYGKSKLVGEQLLGCTSAGHLLIRTSGLWTDYDANRTNANFPSQIIARLRKDEKCKVASDLTMRPTYAPHLAKAAVALIMMKDSYEHHHSIDGTYHITNFGPPTNWYEVARAVSWALGGDSHKLVEEIDTFSSPAERPPFSVLDCSEFDKLGLYTMPDWREAIKESINKNTGVPA